MLDWGRGKLTRLTSMLFYLSQVWLLRNSQKLCYQGFKFETANVKCSLQDLKNKRQAEAIIAAIVLAKNVIASVGTVKCILFLQVTLNILWQLIHIGTDS